jgi:hypothetical protein
MTTKNLPDPNDEDLRGHESGLRECTRVGGREYGRSFRGAVNAKEPRRFSNNSSWTPSHLVVVAKFRSEMLLRW